MNCRSVFLTGTRPFDNMSFDAFKKVLDPKVVGTQLLDELFYETPLDFFIVFSSVVSPVQAPQSSPFFT